MVLLLIKFQDKIDFYFCDILKVKNQILILHSDITLPPVLLKH